MVIHFDRFSDALNRPYFLDERDQKFMLFFVSADKQNLCYREIEITAAPPPNRTNLKDENPTEWQSLQCSFGDTQSIELPAITVLGISDGMFYCTNKSARNESTKGSRIEYTTGKIQHIKFPPGVVTRFCESNYFLVEERKRNSLFQWNNSGEISFVRELFFPDQLADHVKIAYKTKVMFLKAFSYNITFNCFDLNTGQSTNRLLTLLSRVTDDIRWFCAKDCLISFISGKLIIMDLLDFTFCVEQTNLDANSKTNPFAIDSEGFVYLTHSSDSTDCSLWRARIHRLNGRIETSTNISTNGPNTVKSPKNVVVETVILCVFVEFNEEVLVDEMMHIAKYGNIGETIMNYLRGRVPKDSILRLHTENKKTKNMREVKSNASPYSLRLVNRDSIIAIITINDEENDNSPTPTSSSMVSTSTAPSTQPIEEIGEGCSNAKLIEVVQSLPEIWDKDHEKYRSSIKASYWKIMSGTPTGGPLLKRRWETLIREYQRERRKYVASGSAGPGVTPLFPEYSMLGFLDKITDDSGKRTDSSTICSAASSKSEDVISLDDIDDEFDSNVIKAAASKPAAKPVTDRNLLKRKKKDGEDDELGNLIDKIGTLVDKEYAKNDSSSFPEKDLDVHGIVQDCLTGMNPIKSAMWKLDLYKYMAELTLKHKGTVPEVLQDFN
ncbi:hypothetical protein PFISCL1PPCAC_27096 [Pristionchus fissidentatus]|uniref:MADF domain-containing protein n=1 Tax=Pristionchus fissidentatus TaxID=1538716 RepID=A0AAV5X1Y2_9BILA|nr:hypothetical protein PFISCL1PPCAC_27096 [Pristionchus fissidentatus]